MIRFNHAVLVKSALTTSILCASMMAGAMSNTPEALDTDVVLTNSTLDTLTVTLQGDARVEAVASEIPPLATRTVARLGRDSDSNTDLDIRLSAADYSFTLTQQTQGTDLSFAAQSSDWQVAQQSNEDIHRFSVNLASADAQLAVKGTDLDDGGSLQYAIQP